MAWESAAVGAELAGARLGELATTPATALQSHMRDPGAVTERLHSAQPASGGAWRRADPVGAALPASGVPVA